MRRLLLYGLCLTSLQLLAACGSAENNSNTTLVTKPEQGKKLASSEIGKSATLIVAFGDSLYAGYGLAPNDGFVPELEKALNDGGNNVKVHNAGVSGDTTAAGLRRMDFVLDSSPRKPDLVILGLGGNDLLRGLKPSETRFNLSAMLDKLNERDIPVLLTGLPAPANLGSEFGKEFNAIYPDLAIKYNVPLYPFFLNGLVGKSDLMLDDGIHPNAKGIDVIVTNITPEVTSAIEANKTQ